MTTVCARSILMKDCLETIARIETKPQIVCMHLVVKVFQHAMRLIQWATFTISGSQSRRC